MALVYGNGTARAHREGRSYEWVPINSLGWPLTKPNHSIFTARRYASAVLAVIVCPSVRPSVCTSVTSRSCIKIAKCRITLKTPCDSPGTLVFWCKKITAKFQPDHPPKRGLNRGVVGSNRRFSTNLAISQKRCKIGTYFLRKANRNSYALYRMALFSIAPFDRAHMSSY